MRFSHHHISKGVSLLLLFGYISSANAQDLEDYRWKNRILIVMDTENDSVTREKQLEAFNRNPAQLRERDLLLFVFDGRYLKDESGEVISYSDMILSENHQGILLLGKDGGVKLKRPMFTNPQEVFDVIDSMPMRRAEIRSKKN